MRRRRHTLQVSTFPFLAVLLCAMGSLILVLLVMDRRSKLAARARGQREADRHAALCRADWEQKRQARRAEWQRQQAALDARRAEEQRALLARQGQARERLADAAARLREEQQGAEVTRQRAADEGARVAEHEQAVTAARDAAREAEQKATAPERARAEMTADLARLERAVKDLKESQGRDARTYSVVPYRGKHGEARRPLYVECGAAGLVFHPDRTALPMTAPAEVRAEVERRVARQKGSPEGRAYLLLLVRPDGVTTYYQLQAALRDVPADFGYEFVDADWALDFPEEKQLPTPPLWTGGPPAAAEPSATGTTVTGVPAGATGAVGPSPPSALTAGGSPLPPSGATAAGGEAGSGRFAAPSRVAGAESAKPRRAAQDRGFEDSAPATPTPSSELPTVPKADPPASPPGAGVPPARMAPAGGQARPPAPLRPAWLHGDRALLLFVECQPDGVVLYPSRRRFAAESLNHSPAHNPLYKAVRQQIDRRQATLAPGDKPYRPEVRFLVRPDGVRTFHLAYPALERLAVPKTRQNLHPEDDVAAVVAGD